MSIRKTYHNYEQYWIERREDLIMVNDGFIGAKIQNR